MAVLVGLLTLVLVALALPITPATATEPRAAGPGKSTAAAAELEDPLLIHLDSITPSTLEEDDDEITLSGTVTNASDETWTSVKLYSFRSAVPILDAGSLAVSVTADAAAPVGERVIATGTAAEASVEALPPEATTEFTLTVPRSELAISLDVNGAGVYWLGVQALGESETVPRDLVSDGRARTFIPLVASSNEEPVEAAVVVPVRETVWLRPDGRIDRIKRWARSLAPEGRLRTIIDIGAADPDVPLTWLVDPAVLGAVARLAAGNPPRSLAPDPAATTPEQPDEPTDPAAEGGGPAPYRTSDSPVPQLDPDDTLTDEEQSVANLAQDWLERFQQVSAGQTVLALPYGDLDVSAAAVRGPSYYPQAVARSAQVMGWLGIQSTPAIAPRDGILSAAAIQAATEDSTILVGDTSAFPIPTGAPDSMVRLLGHKVLMTSVGAAAGGPSPTAADDPLALRQRLLSEVALRRQSDNPSPVVMMLPADWRPSDPAQLLDGLDVPWLELVQVADVAARPATSLSAANLAYTESDRAQELGPASFTAAEGLTKRAEVLGGILSLPTLVRQWVADEVLMSLSSGHRPNADKAAESVTASTDDLSDQLARITVVAQPSATLSSESGTFGTDVVNGLDQPVTVRLTAQTDGELTFKDAAEPLQLGAGRRTRVLTQLSTDRPGIHRLRLVVTDVEGTPTGASATVQVRAAQVSRVIWLLLAGSALLLFGTIGVRLVRRLRGRPADDATSEAD